jgi:hypothetical protein
MVCAICLEKSLINDMMDTSCNHYFHTECLKGYYFSCIKLKNEINCPLCRSNPLKYEDKKGRRCQIMQQMLLNHVLAEIKNLKFF